MHDAERVIADPVVRNRGTIGGSLGQADPAEDLTTVCDVLRAQVVIAGPRGERVVDIDQFHRGPYETACEQHELLTEIRFPIRPRMGSAYEKVERRVGDWAVGAAGAALWMAEDGTDRRRHDRPHRPRARGSGHRRGRRPGRASGPARTSSPRPPTLAAPASSPIEDQRGPVDYKRHLADELTRRVLGRALDRAAHPTAVQGG